MMQVVKKWKVKIVFDSRVVEFWVHDNFLSNVLRKIVDMQFTESGLEQPTKVVIE